MTLFTLSPYQRGMIVTVFLCLVATGLLAQRGTIKGRIIDSKTLESLPYSSVYINNTTIGTFANGNGEFKLSDLPTGNQDLIVSHAGYQAYQTKIIINDSSNLFFSVKLVSQVLHEIVITSGRDKRWKDQLKRFNLLFFGDSKMALQCKILNPWVLEFKEENGLFTAAASLPLNIENLPLGYRMSYQLKQFSVNQNTYTISGFIWFQQIPTADTTLLKLWFDRRGDAYRGSSRHLLKSILAQTVKEEGFDLYQDKSGLPDVVRQANFLTNINNSIIPFSPDGKVHHDGLITENSIQLPARLEAHYLKKAAPPKIYRNIAAPISWIEVKGGSLRVTNQGIALNPDLMVISGAMGESRVAEALPYDYIPPANKAGFETPKTKISSLSVLVEQPYLQTDRSYYYPGEVMWFKAYMNYYSSVYRDSLSKVLYVDLIGSKGNVVATRICQIDSSGTATGDVFLNPVATGDYELRAYTRWMLNFGKHFVFTKPIKIVELDEIAQNEEALEDTISGPGNSSLRIWTDQEKFYPGEGITLHVQALNSYNFPVASNLSVSVTDVKSSVRANNERTIVNDFNVSDKLRYADTLIKEPPYPIQAGIDMKGQFLSIKRKHKLKQGIVTIVQENSNDSFKIVTDPDGNFLVPNLQLYDSARISVEAVTLKGRKPGYVVLDSFKIAPPFYPVEPLQLRFKKLGKAITPFEITNFMPARVLEEVVIKDTKRDTKTGPATHLFADVTLKGESLRSGNYSDLLSTLQSRVSGLRIVAFVDKTTGQIRRRFKLGGPISLGSDASEPLVLVDGAIVYPDEFQTAAEQIASMSLSEIDHIEILKYGSGAAYGARGANGVIAIYTNAGKPFNEKTGVLPYDKEKLQKIKRMGFTSINKFKALPYSEKETRINSDYNATIYWNPGLITTSTGPVRIAFSVPVKKAQYRVSIEGVTVDGKPVRATKILTIEGPTE